MKKFVILFLVLISQLTAAKTCTTQRQYLIKNASTTTWRTTICPNQNLNMHFHQYARVVIPEENGLIKVIYKSGKEKLLTLKKNSPIFLKAETAKELHGDENLSKKALHVMVIEFKNG